MESMDVPSRYRERSLHYEGKPPLANEQAREKKRSVPGQAVEKNNKIRARTQLMQIYSLQFLNFDSDDLHHVFGTVEVGNCAGWGCMIFNCHIDNESHHDIDPQGYARLIGPTRPISGHTEIFPRLFRKNDFSSLFHPLNLNQIHQYDQGKLNLQTSSLTEQHGLDGKVLLTERQLYDAGMAIKHGLERLLYDRVLSEEFETLYGPARVVYSVFRDSVEAFLRVKILKFGGKVGQFGNSGNLYGAICACSEMLNDSEAKTFVFDRKRDEALIIRAQQFMPLQRNVIFVPMDYGLKLNLEIFINREVISENYDEDLVVVKCGVNFMPKCWFNGNNDEFIRDSVKIETEFCEALVEVFWSAWWVVFLS